MPKHKDVKKAFMGLAVEAAKKSPMPLIVIGADKLLKKSSTVRDAAGLLGLSGKALQKYYDKEDSKSKSTGQLTAKRMGGVAVTQKEMDSFADGGEVELVKGQDYIKDLL